MRPTRVTDAALPSIEVKIKAVSPLMGTTIPLPEYKTSGAAGVDLAACVEGPITLEPGERRLIPTGIAVQLPHAGVGAFIFAHSGLAAKEGLALANGVGVVDSDYTGEVLCAVEHRGANAFTIHPGDRIAQMVFLPVMQASLLLVDHLDPTPRGAGGFGHTGV